MTVRVCRRCQRERDVPTQIWVNGPATCHACTRARYLERKREDTRMRYRLHHAVEPMTAEEYAEAYGSGVAGHGHLVAAAPLREAIVNWLASGDKRQRNVRTLAAVAGVSERRIYAALHEQERVSLRLADHVCVAIELPLSLVYMEER